MKYTLFLILVTVLFSNLNAQIITVDDTFTPQELIENNLVEGCVEVSNITSQVNGSVNGFGSFGYFQQSTSNFPFQDGIVLSTGNVLSGGNAVNTNTLNEGETTWGTDTDLETALGISNTFNATSIEFDFVSVSNLIQFNYILASEEYYANYPCDYSDGFAFLIKEAGTSDPYTNIALIPGTSIPVNTNTIHDAIAGFCDAENDEYFDGYNIGDTNYNGRTTVLTASANIVPYVQYHIKLVIADQTDENYDSAVFIQGNSFNSTVDIGPDVTTCADSYDLDADIQNAQATYEWFLDGGLLAGETNPTLTATASGEYTVEISIPLNDMDCIIEDSAIITVNSEQSLDGIPNFELCDNDENGSELFDLSLMDSEILNLLVAGNYDITYYTSFNDAQNGANAVTTVTSAANALTIHVRIEDIDNGCLTYGTFDLIINEIPNINPVTNIDVCDDEVNDGSTDIYLTDYVNDITNNNSTYQVTFHYTQLEAENGLNPIPSPYVNTNPNEIIYASVIDPATGCMNTAPINLSVIDTPQLQNDDLTPLTACEPEGGDGFEVFDLTEVYVELLQGLSNVTVTFHETLLDAQEDTNAISDPTNYTNTNPFVQLIYIRVEDDTTGCATITSVLIHTNILITGTNIADYEVCDDTSGDGIEDFDLLAVGISIINDLEDVTIEFYETEDDQTNQVNPIDQNVPYTVTSSPHTIYFVLSSPDCEHPAAIDLIILPPIDLQPIAPIDYCDIDDDGIASIELPQFNSIFMGSLTTANVSYYANETDAINNENQLPNTYVNATGTITLWVRVTVGPNCFDTMSFDINVLPAPSATDTPNQYICDNDTDGYYIVNLNNLIPQIVTDLTDLTITFHNSLTDLDDNSNAIVDTVNYNATTETVYIRVTSNITGCYATIHHNITVSTLPDIPEISDYFSCETDGNQNAEFLFVDKDAEILNGQTDKQVLYFETQNDAINRTNEIDKNSLYTNTSSPQTIWVRVENIADADCYDISSFVLVIGSIPIYDAPANYLVCDDESNDGVETFDLNNVIAQMSANTPETLSITFHLTFDDANNALNDISLNYTNIENPQQIFARVENGTQCHSVASFSLNAVQNPTANIPPLMEECDDDYDGLTVFDLTESEVDILDIRNDDIVITYFETIEDLEADTNQIPNPDNYTNIENPQIVQVKVTNVISSCYTVVPLELNVILPPLINDIPFIEICENDTSTYNLDEATALLFDDTTDVIISYHDTINDAQNNANILSSTYTYTTFSHTIFVRAESALTGCIAIHEFDLLISPTPIANALPNIVTCDDNFDNIYEFDISVQTPIILGSQNPNDFTVTYHETQFDAENNENEIVNIYDVSVSNTQTFYVRIEDNDNGCWNMTTFDVIVNRKPFVNIPQQVICLDFLPLTVIAGEIVAGDTYLWSTGETTSEIEITQIGDYWVTVTTPQGCTTTSSFNAIESEPAEIIFTETIDFSDPNNVTIEVTGIGDYVYQLDDLPPQDTGFFQYVPLGYHTITVIDLNGCNSVTKEIVVIDAPKFMTPNGDTYFDTWHIVGVELLVGTKINIFDRYGKLLKTLYWNTPGWDGTYNGNLMPATDYWYVADVKRNGIEFQVIGHFALRR